MSGEGAERLSGQEKLLMFMRLIDYVRKEVNLMKVGHQTTLAVDAHAKAMVVAMGKLLPKRVG